MIKCNSYKRILDQDSHYIEKLNYELGGWATIKNVLDSKPNLVSSNDIEWVNENINKAVLKYNYGIETVLDDYKKIPKDRPVQFYFDAGYVGWYDENKGENEFEPCPPHIGFNTSYAQMYPDSNRTKNITIVVTEDCPLACSYCVSGDTRIRMADYSEVPISEIKIGDSILGFEEFVEKGKHTNLMTGIVTNVFHRKSPVYKIELENGERLFITGNHKLLTSRVGKYRWKESSKITTKNMVKTLPFVESSLDIPNINKSEDYYKGYLVAAILGDGLLKHYPHKKYPNCGVYKFRIAVKDTEIIDTCKIALDNLGVSYYTKPFLISKKENLKTDAIFSNRKDVFYFLENFIKRELEVNTTSEYLAGFLAGIYDTEGNINSGTIRITNTNTEILNETKRALNHFSIPFVFEDSGYTVNFKKYSIRICGARRIDTYRFLKIVQPSVLRKSFKSFGKYRALLNTKVKNTEFIKEEIDVYNIETTCHTYIANNIGVHNCYQHNKNKTYMTPARACEIVDFLFKQDLENSELVNSDVANGLIIEFIGGEPLMAMDTINSFMEHFLSTAIKMRHRWATRYMISISSNGVLYDTPKVREFIEKYKTRLSLNITIDGNKTLHDSCRVFKDGSPSYDIVERSVKEHLAIAPYSSTKLTLSPENIIYTSDAIKNLFTNVGLRVVFANCIFEDGWTPNHAKTLYWQMKDLADWLIDNDFENKYYCSLFSDFIGHPIPPEDNNSYCGGTGAMLSFTADGGIQPCLRYCAFNLNGKRPELRIGTVQDGLLSTDEQKRVFADLKSITRRSQSTDECFYCPIASGCAYCSAHNYEEYGTANRRTTAICPMHKARVLANYYYWNRLYQKRGVDKRVKIDIPDNMAIEIIGADEFAMIKNI